MCSAPPLPLAGEGAGGRGPQFRSTPMIRRGGRPPARSSGALGWLPPAERDPAVSAQQFRADRGGSAEPAQETDGSIVRLRSGPTHRTMNRAETNEHHRPDRSRRRERPGRHGPGGVPPPRPRRGGLDGRLLPRRGDVPGARARAARRRRRGAPGIAARARGAHGRDPRRLRADDRPRDHPLEPPVLLRLLRDLGARPGIVGELLAAGLDVNGMLWRTVPGGHGAGAGDARLAAADDGPAGRVVPASSATPPPSRRCSHSPRRARRGRRWRSASAASRGARPPAHARLLLGACALLGRQGGDRARARAARTS